MLKSNVSLSRFTLKTRKEHGSNVIALLLRKIIITHLRLSTWNLLGPFTSKLLKVALNSAPRSMLTEARASGSSGGIENSSEILPVANRGLRAFTESVMHLLMSGLLRLHTWMVGAEKETQIRRFIG